MKANLPTEYPIFLQSIKAQVQQAQLQATFSVNKQLILLYWQIGKGILERQKKEGWGAGVIEKLSTDLHSAFPQMKGFSPRNLKYMRAFAETYPIITFVQQVAAQIPWFHNCILLDKVKDQSQREWYIQQTIQNGWSRNILAHQIDSGLFNRQGKALTNFKVTLPSPDSDLAQNTLKDPYIFDFLTLEQ